MRALPLWPDYLPKAPPPNTITLEIRFQRMNLGGGAHERSVHNSYYLVVVQENNDIIFP